jgi:hypothetical protein
MRGSCTLLVLTLGFFSSGCIVVRDVGPGTRIDYSESAEDARARMRNRQWAAAAWQQDCLARPQRAVSPDYAQGFKDGFAEHLGSGQEQPPRSAPSRYRAIQYQTPQGYRAIEDWFDGYRYGIAAAIESGGRRWITGPDAPPAPPNHDSGPVDDTALLPKRMPSDAPQSSESMSPEIRFGLPQSGDEQPPPLREMLLPPIGVDREGDPPPRAVVPPPTLGGPQAPGSAPKES